MNALSQMRVFLRVVECGSLTSAAKTFNTSAGAISRSITELETRLRARLINRSTRKISITDAGLVYASRCRQVLADLEYAEEEVSNAIQRPSGRLRVAAYPGIGVHYLVPAIREYRSIYSEVSIELNLTQKTPDLFAGETDVAIVTSSPPLRDSELVATFMSDSYSVLCASPNYIRQHGAPQTPGELSHHECLILRVPTFPAYEWHLDNGSEILEVRASGGVELNDVEAIAAAIREGMGIGILPVFCALSGIQDGSLVRILPNFKAQRMSIFTLHPSRHYTDAKIRTWINFLHGYLPRIAAEQAHQMETATQA